MQPSIGHSIEKCLAILLQKGIGPAKFFKYLDKEILITKEVAEIIAICNKNNIYIIPFYSDLYPQKLLQIKNYPPIIFAKGDIGLLNRESIAIVGSREASAIGIKIAYEWSEILSQKYIIVSGLAPGIDINAMHVKSIGVLASGILHAQRHFHIIDNGGLLISESFPHHYPQLSSFAMRNRIISGLCHGSLIVECKIKSGTMRTARYTLEQGRELYVIPGHILDYHYTGNNYLIKHTKAQMILSVNDILYSQSTSNIVSPYDNITQEEKFYSLLSTTPIHISEIANIMNLSLQEIQIVLSKADLKYNNIRIFANEKVAIV